MKRSWCFIGPQPKIQLTAQQHSTETEIANHLDLFADAKWVESKTVLRVAIAYGSKVLTLKRMTSNSDSP